MKGGAGISVSRLEGCLNVLEDTSTCSNAAISTGTMEAPHPYSALDQTSCKKVNYYFSFFKDYLLISVHVHKVCTIIQQ